MDKLREEKKKKRGNQEIPEDQKKKNHIMIQNLWDTAKAVLRRKFIAIQVYLRK